MVLTNETIVLPVHDTFAFGGVPQERHGDARLTQDVEEILLVRFGGRHHNPALRLTEQERVQAHFTVAFDIESKTAGRSHFNQCGEQSSIADIVRTGHQTAVNQHAHSIVQLHLKIEVKMGRGAVAHTVHRNEVL